MSEVLRERTLQNGVRLAIERGDLTTLDVDAVVNAANEELRHEGGLAAALARAGGPDVQGESDAWVRAHGPVPTGTATLTGAGELPALWIIHAVGPVWRGGDDNEDELLRSALRQALHLARAHGLRSVGVPALSAGVFGFPKDRCARNLLDEAVRVLSESDAGPRDVRFVLRDDDVAQAFLDAWDHPR